VVKLNYSASLVAMIETERLMPKLLENTLCLLSQIQLPDNQLTSLAATV
jgi:hypothetical protein